MKGTKLEKLRKKIDEIDEKIVSLLNRRAKIALKISKEKKKVGGEIYSPYREKEILERIKRLENIFPEKSIENIYSEIISATRSIEKEIKITYLGPKGTFTEVAAIKKFGRSANYIPLHSIKDVFNEVEKGNADFGVVPIENSSEGSVTSTLDMFFDSNLKICGEVIIDVVHCLLSNSKISEIKKLYCHPLAFAQCEEWISKNLPNVKIIEVGSTAKAAEIAAKEKNSAAIASELAAREYNLKILARNIQDEIVNKTRFLIIGKCVGKYVGRYVGKYVGIGQNSKKSKKIKSKTSILFTVKHVPGALFRALKSFSDYKINLTKIESRPIKGKLWEYAFFVDFQGHVNDKKVKAALKKLKENCIELKILGSYPEEK